MYLLMEHPQARAERAGRSLRLQPEKLSQSRRGFTVAGATDSRSEFARKNKSEYHNFMVAAQQTVCSNVRGKTLMVHKANVSLIFSR